MSKQEWKLDGSCLNYDTTLFFEQYEDVPEIRPAIDKLCKSCPIAKTCFAYAISNKEWGVWGGIYLEGGKLSREFNRHKTKKDWGKTWQYLTMDREG